MNRINQLFIINFPAHITQKQLSNLTGIDQADISKIETENANPKLSTLQRLADAMDIVLKFELVPKQA